MDTIIDNLVTIFKAAISTTISANSIYKGFDQTVTNQIPIDLYPYVAFDDGGEEVLADETETGSTAQERFYRVNILYAVIIGDVQNSLSAILDLYDEGKTLIELPANKQLEGHVWSNDVIPVGDDQDTQKMWRGRMLSVQFRELEDKTDEF